MNFVATFFIGLLPLVVFVLIDYYSGLKHGVMGSLATAVALGLFWWLILDYIDFEILLVIVTIAAFGFLAIKKQKPIYFRLQPAVTGILVSLVLLWFQLQNNSFMLRVLPKFEKLMDPSMRAQLQHINFVSVLSTLEQHMIFWMFVHSLLVLWAAVKSTNKVWLICKAVGVPFVTLATFLTYYFFSLPKIG